MAEEMILGYDGIPIDEGRGRKGILWFKYIGRGT